MKHSEKTGITGFIWALWAITAAFSIFAFFMFAFKAVIFLGAIVALAIAWIREKLMEQRFEEERKRDEERLNSRY